MNQYKSWSKLNKQLSDLLCNELKHHLSYFLTRYHKAHNSYGRAAIWLDNRELVCFSWVEMYHQDDDLNEIWQPPLFCILQSWRLFTAITILFGFSQ